MTSTTQLDPGFVVHDEKLADIHDEGHARRAWWLNLYLLGGTVDREIERIERAVERAERKRDL